MSTEILLAEYQSLRAEILQSISKQHQILLGGYGLALTTFGYSLGTRGNSVLIAIPIIFLAMSALWLVECNRVVRASYYIACILWPEIRKAADDYVGPAGWEDWIRLRPGDESRLDRKLVHEHEISHADDFRTRQSAYQKMVVVWLPSLPSALAILGTVATQEPIPAVVVSVAIGAVWFRVHRAFNAISDRGAIRREA